MIPVRGERTAARLLVSVRSIEEAKAALAGGADLIDIKEPTRGSLGKADDPTIAEIAAVIGDRRPLSAAMGELRDYLSPTRKRGSDLASTEYPVLSTQYSVHSTPYSVHSTPYSVLGTEYQVPGASPTQGLAFLKWGLANCKTRDWPSALDNLRAQIAASSVVVTVAYADWHLADAPELADVVTYALQRPGGTLLVDTWCKNPPKARPLLGWLSVADLLHLCRRCHQANVRIALAGALDYAAIDDLKVARPDWFAVRAAVCDAGRNGRVAESKVRSLCDLIRRNRLAVARRSSP